MNLKTEDIVNAKREAEVWFINRKTEVNVTLSTKNPEVADWWVYIYEDQEIICSGNGETLSSALLDAAKELALHDDKFVEQILGRHINKIAAGVERDALDQSPEYGADMGTATAA